MEIADTDGADFLQGGAGNEIYNYASGDGNDVIAENSGTDKIVFGAGISSGSLTFTREGNDMVVDVDDGVHTGQIVVADQFVAGGSGCRSPSG